MDWTIELVTKQAIVRFQIRTNKDGSKTQVVRQYGSNTTNPKSTEPPQATYQQKSFVYINGMAEGGADGTIASTGSCPSLVPATGGPLSPISSPVTTMCAGGGSSIAGGMSYSSAAVSATLPRTTASEFGRSSAAGLMSAVGGGVSEMAVSGSGSGSGSLSYRGHIVRLNSIDPNTVMFSTKDYPILGDVTVPEIIDELEKQFEDKMSDLQGVRLVANNVYICLSRKESLQQLTTYGFYVRGVSVKVS